MISIFSLLFSGVGQWAFSHLCSGPRNQSCTEISQPKGRTSTKYSPASPLEFICSSGSGCSSWMVAQPHWGPWRPGNHPVKTWNSFKDGRRLPHKPQPKRFLKKIWALAKIAPLFEPSCLCFRRKAPWSRRKTFISSALIFSWLNWWNQSDSDVVEVEKQVTIREAQKSPPVCNWGHECPSPLAIWTSSSAFAQQKKLGRD